MRGYQKNVIYLKNVGSPVFEEAYFVIRPGIENEEKNKKEKPDFISEANRIIEESVGNQKGKRGAIGLKETIFFISGFLISSIISLVIAYII